MRDRRRRSPRNRRCTACHRRPAIVRSRWGGHRRPPRRSGAGRHRIRRTARGTAGRCRHPCRSAVRCCHPPAEANPRSDRSPARRTHRWRHRRRRVHSSRRRPGRRRRAATRRPRADIAPTRPRCDSAPTDRRPRTALARFARRRWSTVPGRSARGPDGGVERPDRTGSEHRRHRFRVGARRVDRHRPDPAQDRFLECRSEPAPYSADSPRRSTRPP